MRDGEDDGLNELNELNNIVSLLLSGQEPSRGKNLTSSRPNYSSSTYPTLNQGHQEKTEVVQQGVEMIEAQEGYTEEEEAKQGEGRKEGGGVLLPTAYSRPFSTRVGSNRSIQPSQAGGSQHTASQVTRRTGSAYLTAGKMAAHKSREY